MIRRPPRSTLFPYTRSSDLRDDGGIGPRGYVRRLEGRYMPWRPLEDSSTRLGAPDSLVSKQLSVNVETGRSEEHTSELQSRLHLVCRLLLEKKNIKSPHAHF